MPFFILQPLLALVPAALLFALWRFRRRPVMLLGALAWLGYTGWEVGMQRRWLCTGECNIRVDLLLIYPALLLLTLAAGVAAIRKRPGT